MRDAAQPQIGVALLAGVYERDHPAIRTIPAPRGILRKLFRESGKRFPCAYTERFFRGARVGF